MKRLLLVAGILGAAVFALMYFGEDHQNFLRYADQRDRWHVRCDAYRRGPRLCR